MANRPWSGPHYTGSICGDAVGSAAMSCPSASHLAPSCISAADEAAGVSDGSLDCGDVGLAGGGSYGSFSSFGSFGSYGTDGSAGGDAPPRVGEG
jgi:hypothetical protein